MQIHTVQNRSNEYLGRNGWTADFDEARIFTDRGHAKNAINWLVSSRQASAGDEFTIQAHRLARAGHVTFKVGA